MPSASVYILFQVSPKASSDLLLFARWFAYAGLLPFAEGPCNTSPIAIATWTETGGRLVQVCRNRDKKYRNEGESNAA